MVDVILAGFLLAYFSVSFLLILIFIGAVISTGGFQGFAKAATTASGGRFKYNSNKVQWLVAIWIFLWPLVVVAIVIHKMVGKVA